MNLQVDVAGQRDFETLAEIQLRAFENDSDSLLFPLLHPPSTLKPRPAARLRIATDMARRESNGHRFTKAIRWEKGKGEITGFVEWVLSTHPSHSMPLPNVGDTFSEKFSAQVEKTRHEFFLGKDHLYVSDNRYFCLTLSALRS